MVVGGEQPKQGADFELVPAVGDEVLASATYDDVDLKLGVTMRVVRRAALGGAMSPDRAGSVVEPELDGSWRRVRRVRLAALCATSTPAAGG